MRLMFENSTVCLIVDELVCCALIGFFLVWVCFFGNMILAIAGVCLLGIKFSMESLILAQDERWRRA